MLDMETTSLHWPSFCYNREHGKSVKRKWDDEDMSECSTPDQAVPELDDRKRLRTDLPFSSLMRRMAAKYQPKKEPIIQNPIMSIFSHTVNPYSRLILMWSIYRRSLWISGTITK